MADYNFAAIALRSLFDFVILLMLMVTLLFGVHFAINGGKRSVWVCRVVIFCAFAWWLQGSFIIDVMLEIGAASGARILIIFAGMLLMAYFVRKTTRTVTILLGVGMAFAIAWKLENTAVWHDLFTTYQQQLRMDFSTALARYGRKDIEIKMYHDELAIRAGVIAGMIAVLGVIGGNLIGFLLGRIGNNADRWLCYLGTVLMVYPMIFIFIGYEFTKNILGWIPSSFGGYLGGLVLGAINTRNRIRKPKELHEPPAS